MSHTVTAPSEPVVVAYKCRLHDQPPARYTHVISLCSWAPMGLGSCSARLGATFLWCDHLATTPQHHVGISMACPLGACPLVAVARRRIEGMPTLPSMLSIQSTGAREGDSARPCRRYASSTSRESSSPALLPLARPSISAKLVTMPATSRSSGVRPISPPSMSAMQPM